jgi:acetyl-CoA carboxylase beta subunit
MTEYDKVQAGERVRAFLDDQYVKLAFEQVERNAMFAFKTAKTDEELRRAQALAWAVDNVAGLLVKLVEEGELAKNG